MASLSLFPAAAPPVVEYPPDNYPDRTENTNPDEHIRQYMAKGDQAIPGVAGDSAGIPAGDDSDIIGPDLSICVASIIGYP